jgi:hypothetical protein
MDVTGEPTIFSWQLDPGTGLNFALGKTGKSR